MRLRSLRLVNVRSYADERLDAAASIVLVGPNNAGKTTVIEALQLLLDDDDLYGADVSISHLRRGEGSGPLRVEGVFDLDDRDLAFWRAAAADADRVRIAFIEGVGSRCVWIPDGVLPSECLAAEEWLLTSAEPAADGGLWLDLRQYRVILGGEDAYSDWSGPSLVVVRGPDAPPAQIHEVLRPLLKAALNKSPKQGRGIVSQLIDQSEEVSHLTGIQLESAMRAMGLEGVRVIGQGLSGDPTVGSLLAHLVRFDLRAGDSGSFRTRGRPGGGASRSAVLAALQLYAQPDTWPAERSVILAIEEPEAGLHPALQRRVAATLRSLPTRGVQVIITTHSPVFMNAADTEGVRIVRGEGSNPRFLHPSAMEDVVAALGSRPSDALLGERFLVVEGPSDKAIIAAWAEILGLDLDRRGVRILEMGGTGAAHLVARLADIAYSGAAITVMLDGDASGNKAASAVRELDLAPRVRVRQLKRQSIESYFSLRAANVWLRLLHAQNPGDPVRELSSVDLPALRLATRGAPGTPSFDKVVHGRWIASQMTQQELDPEIVSILAELTSE